MLSSLYTSSDVNILVIFLCYWIARDIFFNSTGSWDDCPYAANKVRIRIERMISFWRKKLNVPILTWFVYYVQKFEHINVFYRNDINLCTAFFYHIKLTSLKNRYHVLLRKMKFVILKTFLIKKKLSFDKSISVLLSFWRVLEIHFVDLLRNYSFERRLRCTIHI